MMRRLLALGLGLALAGGALAAERITPEALSAVPPVDVVILGEVHDNPVHHENQARAVAALQPAAIVLEMLTPAQAARITPELRGDAEALARALGWAEAGWPDFAMYHPILTAAPGAAILGGGLPRGAVRAAVEEGAAPAFARATGGDPARFGLDAALLEAEQTAREADQSKAHCGALPAEMLPGMVAAQRLRDAALARAVIRAAAEHGTPVALITGNGHARSDRGVPAMLARAAPGLSALSIGQVEGEDADAPFDRVIVTGPSERGEDPCAAFETQG